jgi:TRAF3-interacting protein 1
LDQPGGGGSSVAGDAPKVAAAAHIIADGAELGDSDDEADKGAKGELGGFGVVADMAEGASNLVREIENEARQGQDAKNGEESKSDGKSGIRLGKIKKTADAKTKKSMSTWSEQDIEQLRVSVQRLCQSTNPLGKCMDFVHEDLTSMSKEYDRWQTE